MHTRNLTFCTAVLALLSACTAAGAADLPYRAAPPAPVVAPPVFTWTGFYLGAQVGWGQTSTDLTAGAALPGQVAVASLPIPAKNGIAAGLMAGYNYQMGQIVLGVEVDGQAFVTGKQRYAAITGDYITAHTNWVGSLRARLGYTFDRFMVYGTGGLALANANPNVTGTGYSIGAGNSTQVGWTLGLGTEYAITNNWIAGVEYRYAQYQKSTFTYPVGVGGLGIVGFDRQLSTNQVAARLLYKF